MKQPSFYLNLESNTSKSGEKLIYFNLTYGYKEIGGKYIPMRISTQWRILPEYWSKENRKPIPKYKNMKGRDLEDTIEKIRKTSFDQLSFYRAQYNEDPHPLILKELVQIKLGRVKAKNEYHILIDFIQSQIDSRTKLEPSNKLYWSPANAKQYIALIGHITNYENTTQSTLIIESFTEEEYWNFFKTISKLKYNETGTALKINTIAKICSKLRSILNAAIENHINVGFNHQKKGLKINEVEAKHDTYLNEQQLKQIIGIDVSHSKELTHARNYIIMSSFTGLRLDDMIHLNGVKIENMKSKNISFSGFYTKIRKSKSNGIEMMVAIPLLKPVQDILNENDSQFPKFPAASNIRKNIEKLLNFLNFKDKVEVKHMYYGYDDTTELIPQYEIFQPHDCRRTFITNLKQLGIHNEQIEPITHPKVKFASILDKYDKSNLMDKAFLLLKAIEETNSTVYIKPTH